MWADIRMDEVTGQLVKLIVCNEGPTVATDVKVHFSPPLVSVGLLNDFEAIQRELESGFPSIPPGRRLIWNLALGMKLFDESVNVPLRFHVAITGQGPFGLLPRLEYTIDLDDMRLTAATPQGSLHDVVKRSASLRSEPPDTPVSHSSPPPTERPAPASAKVPAAPRQAASVFRGRPGSLFFKRRAR